MKDTQLNKFSFRVPAYSNKNEIKKAIRNKFAVDVISISTTLIKGRRQRVGARRTEKRMSPWKKAVVKLPKDQKIGLFDTSEK
jgi:large subunit ribosomal protein L23